jgi:hypothetical protein
MENLGEVLFAAVIVFGVVGGVLVEALLRAPRPDRGGQAAMQDGDNDDELRRLRREVARLQGRVLTLQRRAR